MSSSIGASLKLDGEREFKQALSEINAGLRVNASELNLMSEKHANARTSTQALTEKSQALEKQIFSQTEKVKTLEQALISSAKKNGESSKKTMEWQVSLNKAQTELLKMNATLSENDIALEKSKEAITENTEATNKSQTSTSSLSDIVMSLANSAGINIPPAMSGMTSSLEKVNSSGALLIGVIAGIITGLAKLTIETAKTADDILTLSSTTGMTTDTIQEMRYASEFLDVSLETIDGSMTKLIRNMSNAKEGGNAQSEAFKNLKVSVRDTNNQLKDNNIVFYEVIDALGKVKNETERDAYAMEIFGKSARELNPLIEQGSVKLRELGVEAHNMGYIMDNETLSQFGELDDVMQKMNKQTDALKNSLAVVLLPIITELFKIISGIPVPVLTVLIVVITTLASAFVMIKMVMSTFKIVDFFTSLNPAVLKTTLIIMGVVTVLIALTALIITLTGQEDKLNQTFATISEGVKDITGSTQNQNKIQPSRIPQYAKGTSYHPGGLARVNEEGGEVIDLPQGSRVYPAGVNPGGDTYNITIDAKNVQEFNDIVTIAKRAKQERRAK